MSKTQIARYNVVFAPINGHFSPLTLLKTYLSEKIKITGTNRVRLKGETCFLSSLIKAEFIDHLIPFH